MELYKYSGTKSNDYKNIIDQSIHLILNFLGNQLVNF